MTITESEFGVYITQTANRNYSRKSTSPTRKNRNSSTALRNTALLKWWCFKDQKMGVEDPRKAQYIIEFYEDEVAQQQLALYS